MRAKAETVIKAFVSYVRSVHLHKHKDIFAVSKLPLKDFASALGLPGVPKVKFATRDPSKTKALHSPVRTSADSSNEESSDEEETDLPNKVRTICFQTRCIITRLPPACRPNKI